MFVFLLLFFALIPFQLGREGEKILINTLVAAAVGITSPPTFIHGFHSHHPQSFNKPVTTFHIPREKFKQEIYGDVAERRESQCVMVWRGETTYLNDASNRVFKSAFKISRSAGVSGSVGGPWMD